MVCGVWGEWGSVLGAYEEKIIYCGRIFLNARKRFRFLAKKEFVLNDSYLSLTAMNSEKLLNSLLFIAVAVLFIFIYRFWRKDKEKRYHNKRIMEIDPILNVKLVMTIALFFLLALIAFILGVFNE
jgi:hypothetical protein